MNKQWLPDSNAILSTEEIQRVVLDSRRRALRSLESKRALIIFRLATCCGLRASEIAGLNLGDVRVGPQNRNPTIRVRAEIAKGKKAREVPLHWDAGTLRDIQEWYQNQKVRGVKPSEPFVGSVRASSWGARVNRTRIRTIWINAVKKALGSERASALTVHDGRHTFVSHALAKGIDIVAVQRAAGHANLAVTSIYAHILQEGDLEVGNLFDQSA